MIGGSIGTFWRAASCRAGSRFQPRTAANPAPRRHVVSSRQSSYEAAPASAARRSRTAPPRAGAHTCDSSPSFPSWHPAGHLGRQARATPPPERDQLRGKPLRGASAALVPAGTVFFFRPPSPVVVLHPRESTPSPAWPLPFSRRSPSPCILPRRWASMAFLVAGPRPSRSHKFDRCCRPSSHFAERASMVAPLAMLSCL